MSTSGDTLSQVSEEIFLDEIDEENPSHINYDLTKKKILPTIEYETDIGNNKPKKSFLRNVGNSKRRKS